MISLSSGGTSATSYTLEFGRVRQRGIPKDPAPISWSGESSVMTSCREKAEVRRRGGDSARTSAVTCEEQRAGYGRPGGLHERQVWRARRGVGGGEELNI